MRLKRFTVDLDSQKSIDDHVGLLRHELRLLKLAKREAKGLAPTGKAKKFRDYYDACCRIYDTDISSLYRDMVTDVDTCYYVYAHLDMTRPIVVPKHPDKGAEPGLKFFAASKGLDFMPFYIGKGKGDRYLSGERNAAYQKIDKKIRLAGKTAKIIKIKEGLTESEALQLEAKLIDIFGLAIYDGVLTNLDEGHNNSERIKMYLDNFRTLRRMNRQMYGTEKVSQGGQRFDDQVLDSIKEIPATF
jgi:hypothetical protein